MAKSTVNRLLVGAGSYAVGLFTFSFLLLSAIWGGSFFRKESEKEKNALALARDQYWNLSKTPFPDFVHHFYDLRNGRKLHYVCNKERKPQPGNLVILIHGFPDSYVMWKDLLQEPAIPLRVATYVCVDLPGYGGSDSFDKYDTALLEALAEFIITMRETFLQTDQIGVPQRSTYVVAHDWGGILALRLASEAPALADRFIITNAPHAELMIANRDRVLQSSSKIFKQFRQSPWQNFGCLSKSLRALAPLLIQILMFGYIFTFHLPVRMVNYLATGGNMAFIRGAHSVQRGKKVVELYITDSLAATLGPSVQECKSTSLNGYNGSTKETYGESVLERAKSTTALFWAHTSYYRDGVAYRRWNKSLELIAELYTLDAGASEASSPARRRSSSSGSSALFASQIKGALNAPTTVIWGKKDLALHKQICLDGLIDYLPRDSEVVLLPRSGHWTPLEAESKPALARVVGLYAAGQEDLVDGKSSMTKHVSEVYDGAVQLGKK